MGALNPIDTSFSPNKGLQDAFDKEVATRRLSVAPAAASAFEASKYVSRAIAPSLGPYVLPAIIVKEGLDIAIPKIKQAYYDKMEAAGIALPKGVAPKVPVVPPTAPVAPEKAPFVTPDNGTGTNLISVLSASGANIKSVADAIAHSNTELLKGISYIAETLLHGHKVFENKLTELVDGIKSVSDASLLATDTRVAYKELELSNAFDSNLIDLAYKDSQFSNAVDISNSLYDITQNVLPSPYMAGVANSLYAMASSGMPTPALDGIGKSLADISAKPAPEAPVVNVNVPTAEASVVNVTVPPASVVVNVPDSVTINRTANETALTSAKLDMTKKNLENHATTTDLLNKKLEHITFETTDFQADNLGDEIPSASPQKMRAIKDAVVAKKNSDENTFEVDGDDYDEMFPSMDWEALFTWNRESERLKEVVDGMGEVV
ncbi:MAG: hypothetical protein Q7S59_05885 [Sulfurimonas sp.]|nr:hypothetical protein [Sulfurimonas sp.]